MYEGPEVKKVMMKGSERWTCGWSRETERMEHLSSEASQDQSMKSSLGQAHDLYPKDKKKGF